VVDERVELRQQAGRKRTMLAHRLVQRCLVQQQPRLHSGPLRQRQLAARQLCVQLLQQRRGGGRVAGAQAQAREEQHTLHVPVAL
jgi:hypothetical protein